MNTTTTVKGGSQVEGYTHKQTKRVEKSRRKWASCFWGGQRGRSSFNGHADISAQDPSHCTAQPGQSQRQRQRKGLTFALHGARTSKWAITGRLFALLFLRKTLANVTWVLSSSLQLRQEKQRKSLAVFSLSLFPFSLLRNNNEWVNVVSRWHHQLDALQSDHLTGSFWPQYKPLHRARRELGWQRRYGGKCNLWNF